jgi:hypothetical protein
MTDDPSCNVMVCFWFDAFLWSTVILSAAAKQQVEGSPSRHFIGDPSIRRKRLTQDDP